MKHPLLVAVLVPLVAAGFVILVVYATVHHPLLVIPIVATSVWPFVEAANHWVSGDRRPPQHGARSPWFDDHRRGHR